MLPFGIPIGDREFNSDGIVPIVTKYYIEFQFITFATGANSITCLAFCPGLATVSTSRQ